MNEKVELTEQIFEYWKMRLNHPRARLDPKRRSRVRNMLNIGYSYQDFIDAIDGCAKSSFHQGVNDRGTRYDDIELICRDASHFDRFIEINSAEQARVVEARKRAQDRAVMEKAHLDRLASAPEPSTKGVVVRMWDKLTTRKQ